MGSRGPLRKPNSVRGQREGLSPVLPIPERPECPAWLPAKLRPRFDELVRQAEAAGVPTKTGDGALFAQAAALEASLAEAYKAGDMALVNRVSRSLLPVLQAIGLTPQSRMRMGVRGEKAETVDPLDEAFFPQVIR